MIDRRKLIRLALSGFHGELPFVDFKESLELSGERGRGQFLKAVCALANSNPTTSSYLIIGIEAEDHSIVGATFIDDQKVQPVLAHYLDPAPRAVYENVRWPDAAGTQFIGVLRISPPSSPVKIARDLWKLKAGTHYFRRGSESVEGPLSSFDPKPTHAQEVLAWERNASASLGAVVADFSAFQAQFGSSPVFEHRTYQDQHVVCWSGHPFEDATGDFLREVLVQLLPAQITIFWSCLQPIRIEADGSSVTIAEYVTLWWKGERFIAPFERTRFEFTAHGTYSKTVSSIIQVPIVPSLEIRQLVARCRDITARAQARELRDESVWYEAECLPYELAVGALNGSNDARDALEGFLGGCLDGVLAECHRDALRIVRRALGETPPD